MARPSKQDNPKGLTPKAPKPWDLPALSLRGDDTTDPVYLAVGKALSSWESVENGLASLFAFFVGAPVGNDEPAVRAYGSIVSFKGRCGMVDAAAKSFFFESPNEEHEQRWKELRAALEGYSERRNDIAHGAVRMVVNRVPEAVNGAYLSPGLFASKKFPLGPELPLRYFLTSRQIMTFSDEFFALYRKLRAYEAVLGRKRQSSPRKAAQTKNEPENR